jgi:PST family polysaccharide transporter
VLTTKTLLGAGWTVSARLAGRVVDLVTVFFLARALVPADFGLTAIATSLIAVLDTVLEVPLILALVSLKFVTKSHLDTAFTLGLLRGLLFFLVTLMAAWPFSHIYNDNRLFALVAALACGPVARTFYSPAMVKYIREMSFRQSFIAELIGKLVASVVAISVVHLGGGYWAIVVVSITSSITTTAITYFLAPYRPTLSLSKFSEFSAFLGWFSSAQVFTAFSWQFDRILLGYFISKPELGQYTMASDLAVLPTQSLIGPAMQPLVAAFASIHDDRERVRSAYLRASRFTMALAAPICIGMSLTSDLIVHVLLGAQWKQAGIYLQWIALSIVLTAFYQPLQSLAFASHRTNVIFRLTSTEVCSKIVFISVGLYFYSLPGVIAARVAVSLVMFVLSLLTARYLVDVTVPFVLGSLWKIGAACAAMAVTVVLLRTELPEGLLNQFIELGLTAGFGALVYLGALYALGSRPKDYF